MNLHTKLIFRLLIGLIIVITIAQISQYLVAKRQITRLAQADMELLRNQEEIAARNTFHLVENSVSGSLERGEMEKFIMILSQQKDIQGLDEYSLFSREGLVTHSSDSANVNKRLPEKFMTLLKQDPQALEKQVKDPIRSAGTIEIFNSHKIEADCIRCHHNWKVGEIGGFSYLRMSTKSIDLAEKSAEQTISATEQAIMINSVLTVMGVVLLIITMMYFLIRNFVARPLGHFVGILDRFEKNEGDLTRKVDLSSRDEIGGLARLFNSFITKLNDAISQAQKAAFTVGKGTERQSIMVGQAVSQMRELATKTRENADHAQEANGLMGNVSDGIEQAKYLVSSLKISMEELSGSSTQVKNIIKTIDEIAFQTNLLALNAAVEAARAGEAGKGFAVVAEEVRNLALRSAEAARNTTELIEETVKKIGESENAVTQTTEVFEQTALDSSKTMTLVREITNASESQASGIIQANSVLNEIATVTTTNASQSKELTNTMSSFKTSSSENENQA